MMINNMKRIYIKFTKWVLNRIGYSIVIIKAGEGEVNIDGDKELLRYVDIIGFLWKKEPIKRDIGPNISKKDSIKPLTNEQLKKLGFKIDVDVTDCKNFKETSKVQ